MMNLGDMEYLICEKHNTRSWKKGDYCDECKVEQLEADNARIREELAAAQIDAARYRWLRDKSQPQNRNGPGLYWYLPRFMQGTKEEQLDAAIDNAMKEQMK